MKNGLKIIVFVLLQGLVFNQAFAKEAKTTQKRVSQTSNIESFFKDDDYRNVSLSPDGKHIALIKNDNGIAKLIIVDVATMKATNTIHFTKKDSVGDYYWANNERLLIFLSTKQRNKEQKSYYGELYAIDINKNKGKFVFGVRSLVRKGRIKSGVNSIDYERHLSHPKIIDNLINDDDHVLISTSQYNNEGMWVYKLNIYSGHIETISQIEHESAKVWYLAETNELWLQTELTSGSVVLERFDFTTENWERFSPEKASFKLSVIAPSANKNEIIIKDYCGNDTISICTFNLETLKTSVLFNQTDSDIKWIYLDKNNQIYAYSYFDKYPQIKLINSDNSEAKVMLKLIANFTGHELRVKNIKKNESLSLISITSDVQPRVWYLFNNETSKLTFVAKSNKSIDANKMSQQYSFDFKSRDNIDIQGYVTFPASKGNNNLPAIILVHGGPHSRDYWGFDPEVQLLASKGYAVVQVNFRGSSGFGWDFEKLGFKQWGEKIQFDILDSIAYLVDKKYIDKNRVCIMGGSFGGYSAMQSTLLSPDLFKCTVARSGVYDLVLHADKFPEEVEEYNKRLGSAKVKISHSPVHSIAKLNNPLLLAHGTKDDVTKLDQAEVLIKQLKEHDKAYEWVELENESHYFYNSKNRIKYYERVIQFVQKHNPSVL